MYIERSPRVCGFTTTLIFAIKLEYSSAERPKTEAILSAGEKTIRPSGPVKTNKLLLGSRAATE